MGYYYLTYRNSLMQEAVIKSSQMSIKMLVQNLEKEIIAIENELLLDIGFKGKTYPLQREELLEIKQQYPLIDEIFFHAKASQSSPGQKKDFTGKSELAQALESEIVQSKPEFYRLKHFPIFVDGHSKQAGFVAFPPVSSEQEAVYLLFTLNLNYIQKNLLMERRNPEELFPPHIVEQKRNQDNTAEMAIEKGELIEAPFQDILPFWKLVSELDTSGMSKRARIEFILYSGIIGLVFCLILLSMYFIWVQMQQERRLSRIKSEMISHISHELKTPLSLIRMYSETLMLGRISSPSRIQTYYQIILRECDRLHLLINNTLSFSMIEKGLKEYTFSRGNIGEALQNMVVSYEYYLQENGFTLESDIDATTPPSFFDKIAINQIMGNLIDNAIKFSGETKKIQVKLTAHHDKIVLIIADKGIGMDSGDLNSIFKPYHRLSQRHRGSGIGLSLVQYAVTAHHGNIAVTSKKGFGSSFIITLPLIKDGTGEGKENTVN